MELSTILLENWICIISKKGYQWQLPNRYLVDWLCEEDMSDQKVGRKETNQPTLEIAQVSSTSGQSQ